MSDHVLLVDDDGSITEALALMLERPGRTVVVCSDVESAEITLERFPITHLVTDLQFSGAFGFEGLHFLSRVRAHRPDCRIILMSGFVTDALRTEALRNGATAVLSKPFEARELEAALASPEEPMGAPSAVVHVRSLDDILRTDSLATVYQPIVHLPSGVAFGFEALARVRGGWAAGGPAELFTYASRCSKLEELNLTAITHAIAEATRLPAGTNLFLNVDPSVLELSAFPDAFRAAAEGARIPLDRIVIEVTERSGFHDACRAAAVFSDLRRSAIRFALDDLGSAYSHLSLMSSIQPSFIKISNTFGTNSEIDETKRRIVRNVLALAHDFGCRTILEGIETRETADAATELGVDLAQGFYFGRPHPASHWFDERVRACA